MLVTVKIFTRQGVDVHVVQVVPIFLLEQLLHEVGGHGQADFINQTSRKISRQVELGYNFNRETVELFGTLQDHVVTDLSIELKSFIPARSLFWSVI